MSGPLSAPNSIVYEAESTPRYNKKKKKRRLSPIEESPQLFRRVTRSQSSVAASQKSQQDCLKIERRGVGISSFYLKFAANLRFTANSSTLAAKLSILAANS